MMCELLRDTAFGKLVRITSGHRLLPYPEERDTSIASEYIDNATEARVRFPDLEANERILKPNGLQTIMSQASNRSPGVTIHAPGHVDEKTIIVGWRPGGTEVILDSTSLMKQDLELTGR